MDDLKYVIDKCNEIHRLLVILNTFLIKKDGIIYRTAQKRIEKMLIKVWKIKTDFEFELDPDFMFKK